MAIAIVGGADLGNNGGSTSSKTTAYTVGSGANRLLVVGIVGDTSTDGITGVTYNAVAMTQSGKFQVPSGRWIYMYHLVNPASGSNNVVASAGGNQFIIMGAADYTGVAQSSPTGTTGTNNGTSTAPSHSIVTGTDNSWVMAVGQQPGGTNWSAAVGAERAEDAAFQNLWIADSNAPVHPAGSQTITATIGNNIWGILLVEFKEAVAGGSYWTKSKGFSGGFQELTGGLNG